MDKAWLVATLATPPSPRGEDLEALSDCVRTVEVRADLVGEPDPSWLRSHFNGGLLYSLRSVTTGGRFAASHSQRFQRLLTAVDGYDLVELESHLDLTPELLARIPPGKRLISWYGPIDDLAGLLDRFDHLSGFGARLYKLVTYPTRAGGELAPLALLKSLGRKDTVAFAAGPTGFWTRLVAPHLGAPLIYGRLASNGDDQDEPTIRQLVQDYGLPQMTSPDGVYGIVGNQVRHSLSPRLHNAAYRSLGRRALFVPFHAESFDSFWRELVESGSLEALGIVIRGLTVASPHKEAALAAAAMTSPMVRRAGSTNLFVRNGHGWNADTTDPEGVVLALRRHGLPLKGRRIAVIGCGGAGRAVAAALDKAGAGVTLVNRGLERGLWATRLLRLPFIRLSEFSADGFSIVVNATPVGRDDGKMPFDARRLGKDAVVVDLAYGVDPTPLIATALASGRVAIDGKEVLLIQVQQQFRMMTNQEMPIGLTRRALE
jgi:3-dehydroquinate dehydratase/shikimate dehydrogenase